MVLLEPYRVCSRKNEGLIGLRQQILDQFNSKQIIQIQAVPQNMTVGK